MMWLEVTGPYSTSINLFPKLEALFITFLSLFFFLFCFISKLKSNVYIYFFYKKKK